MSHFHLSALETMETPYVEGSLLCMLLYVHIRCKVDAPVLLKKVKTVKPYFAAKTGP